MQASIQEMKFHSGLVPPWVSMPARRLFYPTDEQKQLITSKEISLKRRITRRLWSQDETTQLAKSYPTDTAVKVIAERLGRSPQAVTNKAKRLGLRRPLTLKRQRIAQERQNFLCTTEEENNLPTASLDIFPKTASGRAIWNTQSLHLLAGLWKRLYSPAFIAEYFGLKYNTVCMAAKRAGLPSRAGFTLLRTSPTEDPFSVAENATLAAQIITRTCGITNTVFFVSFKDRRTQHYSSLGRRLLENRARCMSDYALEMPFDA
ncbi:hypothetical protein AD945_04140 [Gluconobacter albidus]|uniref:Uncharacterized protein n=1 Tax=Gluconobacter albidus TaxID=318683 RepID=A0A149TLF8_9PROT|nr:hypothetical protein [Gluconobacter albidus]KXV49520.1 hypothetical protein AD945_04140 [Gluconobacter albidus]